MSAPFLVATLGTDHHRFDRLISWLDDWLADHRAVTAFVQHGASASPRHAESATMLSRPELLDHMGRASIVITHGGTGSIMDSRACGRMPLVVPRMASRGEHVDDHQVIFARRLASSDWVHIAENERAFRRHLGQALDDPAVYRARPDAGSIHETARRLDYVLADVMRRPAGFVNIRRLRQIISTTRKSRSRTAQGDHERD